MAKGLPTRRLKTVAGPVQTHNRPQAARLPSDEQQVMIVVASILAALCLLVVTEELLHPTVVRPTAVRPKRRE